ncbi:MAG: hypothetical protein AAF206_03160 [Bacteroidota bacterium]
MKQKHHSMLARRLAHHVERTFFSSLLDKRYLARYDMKVYSDIKACVEAVATSAAADTPDWCNSFDVGQECRSCWLSCDGARLFLADFSSLSGDR